MVLSEPENVGASAMMASVGSTKALNASDSACPEPLATTMFSGAVFIDSNISYFSQTSSRRPR
jgi:hypothetical protein